MALRATKGDEKPAGANIWRTKGEQKAGFSTECPWASGPPMDMKNAVPVRRASATASGAWFFNGVLMGLRPTNSDENGGQQQVGWFWAWNG